MEKCKVIIKHDTGLKNGLVRLFEASINDVPVRNVISYSVNAKLNEPLRVTFEVLSDEVQIDLDGYISQNQTNEIKLSLGADSKGEDL